MQTYSQTVESPGLSVTACPCKHICSHLGKLPPRKASLSSAAPQGHTPPPLVELTELSSDTSRPRKHSRLRQAATPISCTVSLRQVEELNLFAVSGPQLSPFQVSGWPSVLWRNGNYYLLSCAVHMAII